MDVDEDKMKSRYGKVERNMKREGSDEEGYYWPSPSATGENNIPFRTHHSWNNNVGRKPLSWSTQDKVCLTHPVAGRRMKRLNFLTLNP